MACTGIMLGEYSYVPAVIVKEFVFIPCLTNQGLNARYSVIFNDQSMHRKCEGVDGQREGCGFLTPP